MQGTMCTCLTIFMVSIVFVSVSNAQEDGDVRLVNGSQPSEGRIEMWYNSTWRAVCGNRYYYSYSVEIRGVCCFPSYITAMDVICKQIGYAGLLSNLRYAPYGPGEFPILSFHWLCNGNESNLLECQSFPVYQPGCEVATVACKAINVGCYDYPTYYDPASDQCVETCPSGAIGVVNGSVDDVTTDRARACVPMPTSGYIAMFNATQYEVDVNVYAPVGTVVFTALVFVENPDNLHYMGIYTYPLSQFSVNGMPDTYQYFNYNDEAELDRMLVVNITLREALNPDDGNTSHQFYLGLHTYTNVEYFLNDYTFADVIVYEETTFPPAVTIEEIDLVPFGNDVSLVCRAGSSPPFTYVWITAKGLEISSDSSLNFTISDVTQYGVYTCEVTNSYGTGSATVEVQAPDCTYEGRFYRIGEQLQTNCSTRCSCRPGGIFKCKRLPCSYDGPTCQAVGDPHYETFDGFWHHFQGTCEYVLTRPCDSEDFIISAGNIGHRGSHVACVGLVRIRIPSEELDIVLERGSLGTITVNNILQPYAGDGVVYETDTVAVVRTGGYPNVFLLIHGVRVFWNGVYRVEVTVSSTLKGHLCGLCGTYNGDKGDDLQTPDGVVVTSVDVFGDSWLVPDPTTSRCSGQVVGKRNALGVSNCSTDPNITAQGQQRCNILEQLPFINCSDMVNATQFINNCEFDYCCCSEAEREDCYCDALSSYASACADAGVSLSTWRSPTLCPLQCPDGMIYQQCGPLCPQTCDNLDVLCEGGCAEGCFCPVGQVLIEGVCMDEAECATTLPPTVSRCEESDQQCRQFFKPATTVHIEIEVICDTSNDLYCDINMTLNTVLQDLVMSSNTIKVCTHFSTVGSDTCLVQVFVLEQITSTPRASQTLTRQLFNELTSNDTLLMYESANLAYGIFSSSTSNNILGLEEWAGVLILAVIGLLGIGCCATCGLLIGVICRRMRTKIVKSHGVSADDNDLDYTPLKSAESAPTSPTEMTTINLGTDADKSNDQVTSEPSADSEKKGSTEDLMPTVI